jgi:hypothetical protein
MHKLSETLYSNLFWLISGLLVWLVIVPLALICCPVIMLVKAVGQVLFKISILNVTEVDRQSQIHSERQLPNAAQPLLTSLLLKTLIEVPALLAAVISLQPTRVIKGEQSLAQTLQPSPAKTQGESVTDSMELPVEE